VQIRSFDLETGAIHFQRSIYTFFQEFIQWHPGGNLYQATKDIERHTVPIFGSRVCDQRYLGYYDYTFIESIFEMIIPGPNEDVRAGMEGRHQK
jgi:hypothetical protein